MMEIERVLENCGGDPETVAELAALFLLEAPKYVAAMEAALCNHQSSELGAAAHKLQGGLGLFVAEAALHQARHLEDIAASGELVGALVVIERLKQELHLVEAFLRDLVKYPKPLNC